MQTGDPITIDGRRLTVVRQLGAGRTAEVFLVEDPGGAQCVVKRLRRDDSGRPMLPLDAFMAEADTLDRLATAEASWAPRGSPRFPRVQGRDAEQSLFAMDYAPGRPLTQILGRTALSIEQCLLIAIQVCEALEIAIEAGVYNVDLKFDAILWNPGDDALAVIDWNVVRAWPPAEPRWIDPYLGCVAELLDRALSDFNGVRDEAPPDWSRPFRAQPERWSIYLRVFQLLFVDLSERSSECTLADCRGRLSQIAEALGGEPDALLKRVIDQLAHARTLSGDSRGRALEEALAFAELAANARSVTVTLRARALIGQSIDLLSDDAEAIATLDTALDGAHDDTHVPPGTTIELHRLRRMAHAMHAALGAHDALREVRDAYRLLQWQTAFKRIEQLLRSFDRHPTLVEELTPLLDESAGLYYCTEAMRALDRAATIVTDDGSLQGHAAVDLLAAERERAAHYAEALESLSSGIPHLRRVPWHALLADRFPDLDALLDEVRQESTALKRRLLTRATAHASAARHASEQGDARQPAPEPQEPASPVHRVTMIEQPIDVSLLLDEPQAPILGEGLTYGEIDRLEVSLDPAESRAPPTHARRWPLVIVLLAVGGAGAWWALAPEPPVESGPPRVITIRNGPSDAGALNLDAQPRSSDDAANDASLGDAASDAAQRTETEPQDATQVDMASAGSAPGGRSPSRARGRRGRRGSLPPKPPIAGYLEDRPPPRDGSGASSPPEPGDLPEVPAGRPRNGAEQDLEPPPPPEPDAGTVPW